MAAEDLVNLGQEALILAAMFALPALVAAAIVGWLSSALQGATGAHDSSLSFLPKLVAVVVVLVVTGAWMSDRLLAFAERALGLG